MRCFWLIWAVFAGCSAIFCSTGFFLPYWITGTINTDAIQLNTIPLQISRFSSTIGLFRRCVYPVYAEDFAVKDTSSFDDSSDHVIDQKTSFSVSHGMVKIQHKCGHYGFRAIPHLAWRISVSLIIVACIGLYFITFLMGLSCIKILSVSQSPELSQMCQLILACASGLIFTACFIYPIGWAENSEVQQICGQGSSWFRLGQCHVGWGYILTLFSGVLSTLAALLPKICFNLICKQQKLLDMFVQKKQTRNSVLIDPAGERLIASSASHEPNVAIMNAFKHENVCMKPIYADGAVMGSLSASAPRGYVLYPHMAHRTSQITNPYQSMCTNTTTDGSCGGSSTDVEHNRTNKTQRQTMIQREVSDSCVKSSNNSMT